MTSEENGAPSSLIKYQSQIQISENIEEYKKTRKNQKVLDPKPSPQDVLNNMIPPRDWLSRQGKFFMQYVSHQQSSRDQVMNLKESLQDQLNYRQARKQGICPIREQLFSQAFDQIIREVTINSPERGLLVMRVRDQHKMTLAAYQTLYQSSVDFGMKKQLEAQEGVQELQDLEKSYRKKDFQLERRKIELLSKKQSLEKKIMERKAIERERREDQLKLISFQADNLTKFLESLQISEIQKDATG